jgi:23S rRNA (uracil1939-C5)-methyltransferase
VPGPPAERELTIVALGAAGDGIAESADGRVYVPWALPGERWRARLDRELPQGGWRATPLACLAEAPRAKPPCPHFGRCGGCRLQHLPPDLYAAHKRARIVEALARRGLPGEVVGEARVAPPASRRRLRLGLARSGRRLLLGFRERGSRRLEPVDACPIARPELAGALPALALELAAALGAPEPAELSLTLTDTGLDLLLHTDRRAASPAERRRLPAAADRLDLARVSWAVGDGPPEPIVVRRRPVVRFGAVAVEPPAGAFLQPTAWGDAALAETVAGWAQEARRAVDLFAGVGTLTFALAAGGRQVRAAEGDPASAAALRQAASAAGFGGVTAAARDLARRPLAAAELKGIDLAVLDPPRAGASEQARELAASPVPRVVYASCSPESFARDARTLVDHGLALLEVRPIDQFLYSAEVELVARFGRPAAPRK